MTATGGEHTVEEHFANRAPEVAATNRAILAAAKKLGPVKEEPKKTSIHLVRKTAFAGIATRRTALKAAADIPGDGIASEQVSANRWHHELRWKGPKRSTASSSSGCGRRTDWRARS